MADVAVSAQGLGACLTQANLEDIKRFVEDFAVRALLPAMEARVRALNHQVRRPSRPLGVLPQLPISGTAPKKICGSLQCWMQAGK